MASSAPRTVSSSVIVNLVPPEISSEVIELSLVAEDFEPKPAKKSQEVPNYLIIGFDTEYVTPADAVDNADIREGRAKYEVLSYQFSCLRSGETWSGIAVPDKDQRMSMSELIVFAMASRPRLDDHQPKLPRTIYLVGHYTKADIPAFSDFKDLKSIVSAIRGSFVSLDTDFRFVMDFPTKTRSVELSVKVRDTYLLSPTGSQSLADLGDMLGIPKILLHEDPVVDRQMKSEMDKLRTGNWDLYRRYAIHDAVICAQYAQKIIDLCSEHLGNEKLPVTLTSIGVDMLLKSWDDSGADTLAILGKEKVKTQKWSKSRGHYIKTTETVDCVNYDLFQTLASESYHGGRNEQYWFGPAFEDNWTDYDLSSAYATAMAQIGTPDWSNVNPTRDLNDFRLDTLGYAIVDFEFPPTVRFPSLPIRTDNGLVFPRTGTSLCSSPEIALAISLGAKLTIKQGVIVGSDPSKPVFSDYISRCIAERAKHPKKSLNDLFWKELSNSTYGKTAQGLREKRVYDSREMETKPLPPSKITNPYFASYITSFVRAAVGEIINALPKTVCVFSCTTDGFLTNATAAQIDLAARGEVASAFREGRRRLTGEPGVLEVKHSIKLPLGWRTRGQATLLPGEFPPEKAAMNTVLAKGGIRLPGYATPVPDQNAKIVEMFFSRTPELKIDFDSLVGIRDIVEYDADLVRKAMSRRVNMEFDWKRKPDLLFDHKDFRHCAFSTEPWNTVEEFVEIRGLFEKYQDGAPVCIKLLADFYSFMAYVDTMAGLDQENRLYVRKESADLKRLRMSLCSAWHQEALGLKTVEIDSAARFATLLSDVGIPCSRPDVENGKNKPFVGNQVVATERVVSASSKLIKTYPQLNGILLQSLNRNVTTSIRPTARPFDALGDRERSRDDIAPWFFEFLDSVGRQSGIEIKLTFEDRAAMLAEAEAVWIGDS